MPLPTPETTELLFLTRRRDVNRITMEISLNAAIEIDGVLSV